MNIRQYFELNPSCATKFHLILASAFTVSLHEAFQGSLDETNLEWKGDAHRHLYSTVEFGPVKELSLHMRKRPVPTSIESLSTQINR